MLDLVLPTYNFTLQYAQKLIADIPDEQLCTQPLPDRVLNHPAFVLGHLAWANNNGATLLGRPSGLQEGWKELYGMGAKPLSERSRYPSKAELFKALEDAHARLTDALGKATPEQLAQPAPERMRNRYPTLAHALLGLMTAHETSHLGQLSAWRRAMGFPSVF